ncbi:MAG: hypothetical protein GY909_03740 [Oligoflexia bacterium]|nr:hypothetical protein [Oligoflexia bacterium]
MKIFSAIILLVCFSIFAQEANEVRTTFEYTKKVKQQLNAIKKLPPENYFKEVDTYRLALEKYMENKKRVCEGEFSTVILENDTVNDQSAIDNAKKGNKLSREERKLCFRELKALQVTFINNMFIARKNYLDHLHNKRIDQLKVAREDAIKNIQMSFSKKRRVIKRKGRN